MRTFDSLPTTPNYSVTWDYLGAGDYTRTISNVKVETTDYAVTLDYDAIAFNGKQKSARLVINRLTLRDHATTKSGILNTFLLSFVTGKYPLDIDLSDNGLSILISNAKQILLDNDVLHLVCQGIDALITAEESDAKEQLREEVLSTLSAAPAKKKVFGVGNLERLYADSTAMSYLKSEITKIEDAVYANASVA